MGSGFGSAPFRLPVHKTPTPHRNMNQTPSTRRRSTPDDAPLMPHHQPHQRPKPGRGPRIVAKPRPDAENEQRTVTMSQRKFDAIIANRVGDVKAKFAPKAALADELVQALAHEAAYSRALEGQLCALGHEPTPRPTTQKDTTPHD